MCHETSDVFTDPKQLKLQSAGMPLQKLSCYPHHCHATPTTVIYSVARPDVQTGPSPFAAASIAQATAAFAAMATTGKEH